MHGKEALAQIISEHPELAVLMLTVSEDGADLADCMRMGARGYLLKNINVEFLLTTCQAVDGDSVLSPEMTTSWLRVCAHPSCLRTPKKSTAHAPRRA